ncbi:I78 family peptidase inhibitor [Streptomyces bacillaris]
MASLPTPPEQPDDAPDAYVGLAADAAEQLARSRGWDTVRAVPPGSFMTMEFRSGRINFQGGTPPNRTPAIRPSPDPTPPDAPSAPAE